MALQPAVHLSVFVRSNNYRRSDESLSLLVIPVPSFFKYLSHSLCRWRGATWLDHFATEVIQCRKKGRLCFMSLVIA